MVSKLQETFNYYSASRQHVRKSTSGPFGHQRDEIEVKITWLTGLWLSKCILQPKCNHKCCFNKQMISEKRPETALEQKQRHALWYGAVSERMLRLYCRIEKTCCDHTMLLTILSMTTILPVNYLWSPENFTSLLGGFEELWSFVQSDECFLLCSIVALKPF